MDFTGKICPYCKTAFVNSDDIVICSICEIPHHKTCCIENKGCTTLGCTGTIMEAEQCNESIDKRALCSRCGSPYNNEQKFCASCGAVLSATEAKAVYSNTYYPTPPVAPQPMYNNQCVEQFNMDLDMQMFIGKNQCYYASKFNRMQMSNSKSSWNWCAFFWTIHWFAYRKMYKMAILVWVGIFLLGLIPGIGDMLSTVALIFVGILGNHCYMQYANSEIAIARNMEPHMKQEYMEKKGGTNSGAVWIIIAISVVAAIVRLFI